MKNLLPGKKTYITIVVLVLTVLASVLPGQKILTPEITAAIVTLLGALAVYFRSLAV